MRRMSRLLSAGCLGLSMAAVFATAIAASENNPARRAPSASAATQGGRVIVKFKSGTATLSAATNGGARVGPRGASILSTRTKAELTDGRAITSNIQVVRSAGLSSSALAALVAKDSDVEWAEVDHRRVALSAPNDPLYPDGLTTTTPAAGQWYLRSWARAGTTGPRPAWWW